MSPIENTAGHGVSLSPILVSIPQAAVMLGRGRTFIYGAISDGKIKAVKSASGRLSWSSRYAPTQLACRPPKSSPSRRGGPRD